MENLKKYFSTLASKEITPDNLANWSWAELIILFTFNLLLIFPLGYGVVATILAYESVTHVNVWEFVSVLCLMACAVIVFFEIRKKFLKFVEERRKRKRNAQYRS